MSKILEVFPDTSLLYLLDVICNLGSSSELYLLEVREEPITLFLDVLMSPFLEGPGLFLNVLLL